MVHPDPGHNRDNYPEWSWDHARTYVAIRYDQKYSDDQIRALAAQDIVMLEKMNGHKAYGSIEKGSLAAAKRIKAINPKVKILFYLNSMVHYNGYDANKTWKIEWAMWDHRKKKHFKWRNRLLSYNHFNKEFREWWIQRALDMVAHDEIDGIFIDGICKTLTHRAKLPVNDHENAYIATAKELRQRLPEGKILIGNALRASKTRPKNLHHLEYLDGSYLEGWANPDRLENTIRMIKTAIDRKRIIMLNAHPLMDRGKFNSLRSMDERYEYAGQPKHINFMLGYFLLVAGQWAHISFHSGVDANPRKKEVWDNTRFEAIMRKLGEPLGPAKKVGDVYIREFEFIKVRVNLKKYAAHLTVKDGESETVPDDEGETVPDEQAGSHVEATQDEGGDSDDEETGSGNEVSSDEETAGDEL